MNNYDELFEKFNGKISPEESKDISNGMQREKTSGEYYLVKAYIHDIQGNEKIAQICYEKADKLGFRESQRLHWYRSYGSTLRWNEKLEQSNKILNEGLEKFEDDKVLVAFLLINKYKTKLITKEETAENLKLLLPNIKDEFWI